MFSVIRKIQGRVDEPPKTVKNFDTNNRHMAKFAVNDNVCDKDPSIVTLGFGHNSFPKLQRLLDEPEADVDLASGAVAFTAYLPQDSQVHAEYKEGTTDRADLINVIRQKSLYALIELLHDPVNVSLSVSHGLVKSLNARCVDPNDCIREYSVVALGMIAEHHLGLQELYEQGSVGVLCTMMDDADHVTRCNVFLSLLKICHTVAGVEKVLAESGSFEQIVEKCRWDDVEIKNLALELLYAILKTLTPVTQEQATRAIKALTTLLEEQEAPLRQWSCNNLMVLTISAEGKQLAIAEGAVPLIVRLLSDSESTVRAAAMGALMNITISKEGKRMMLDVDGIAAMMAMLYHSVNEVSLLNVVKTIANVAECPKARPLLAPCVARLKELVTSSENKLLVQNCQVAIDAVTWTP